MSIVEPKQSARIADRAFRGPVERRRRPRPFRTAPAVVPRRKSPAVEVAPPPKSAVHQIGLAPSSVEPPIKPKTRRRQAKRQARILFH